MRRPPVRHDRAPARDERGAVAVLAAMLMVVVLGIAAVVVDLGMQRVARRDMQALADVVALDVARLLDGREAARIRSGTPGMNPLETTRAASLARNVGSTIGEQDTVEVRAYLVDLDDEGLFARDAAGVPVEVGATQVPDGVVVTASTTVAFGFANALGISEGSATRTAVSGSQATACFKLGSWLTRVRTGADAGATTTVDLLGAQLDAALGLGVGSGVTALGYGGLADATLSVNDLLDVPALSVGSVDELATATVTGADFLTATAQALSRGGNTADAAVITAILAATTTTTLGSTLALGELIAASSSSGAALDTQLNALDLVTGAILLLGSEQNLLAVPLGVQVPGAADLAVDLDLIEAPQVACGPVGTTARTAQSHVDVTGRLLAPASALPLPGTLGGVTLRGGDPFALSLDVARADGVLQGATCAAGTVELPDGMRVGVSSTAATLALRVPVTLEFEVRLSILLSVRVRLSAVATASTTRSSAGRDLELLLPPNDVTPQSTSSGLGLTGATVTVTEVGTTATTSLLGGLVSLNVNQSATVDGLVAAALRASEPVVGTLIGELDALLADDLGGLIGINASGADVFGVPRPDCSTPILKG